MGLDAVKILGINITINPERQILEELQKFILHGTWYVDKKKKKTHNVVTIVTPNPEQVVLAVHDTYFAEMLNRADVALPDGVGIACALKFLHDYSKKKTLRTIPGIEFMEHLIFWAAKQRVNIALIGGRGSLAVRALDCLSKMHPGLRHSWAEDGPEVEIVNRQLRIMNYDENLENRNGKNSASIPVATIRKERYFERLIEKIREHKTQIIFVGLGAPKQEYFIEEIAHRVERLVEEQKTIPSMLHPFRPLILMSVGGSFDEVAGAVPRCPRWIHRAGFKWLWRVLLQPWRIVRQLALLKFIILVIRERYGLR
jgi:N-acetylglucosaminyldiphosphoundecaprenol N-acetyl-beta-D-mannosaminyltransferase